jgi:hypothetical protein
MTIGLDEINRPARRLAVLRVIESILATLREAKARICELETAEAEMRERAAMIAQDARWDWNDGEIIAAAIRALPLKGEGK